MDIKILSEVIERHTGVSYNQVVSDSRKKDVVFARQLHFHLGMHNMVFLFTPKQVGKYLKKQRTLYYNSNKNIFIYIEFYPKKLKTILSIKEELERLLKIKLLTVEDWLLINKAQELIDNIQ